MGSVTAPTPALARNALLSLFSQVVPLLVAILAVPVLLRSLGLERFGVLSLAWVALGYAGVLDLGVARATTRRVAATLASDRNADISLVVSTGIVMNVALGVAAGVALAAVTSSLVAAVFRIPSNLSAESVESFLVVAGGLPIVLASTAARGVLEGAQRFDLITIVSTPSSAATYILPMLGALAGQPLPMLLLLLVLGRAITLVAFAWQCSRAFPSMRRVPSPNLGMALELIRYGGWLTLSGVASPLLVYGERGVVTSVLGVGALALFVIPYELAARIWIVPGSLAVALYPAFATMKSDAMAKAYTRSLLYLLLLLSLPVIFLIGAGRELVELWLGDTIARETAVPLQLFALGAVFTSLASVPLALVQAVGRASTAAALHLAEIVPALIMMWAFSSGYGLIGAVSAWLTRVLFDTAALFGIAIVQDPQLVRATLGRPLLAWVMVATASAIAALFSVMVPALPGRFVALVLLLVAFGTVFCAFVLTSAERADLVARLRRGR